ncbi:CPBP family intramembrane glutamic endopeptidase, partial [Oceanospirillum sp. HFRX-1_2]
MLSGFLEEVLLRGCILMLIVRSMPEQGLLRAVLLSSLMFGLAHWANLLNGEAHWITVLAQVTYGFFIGVGFAAVYVRTRALMPLILVHGGINMTDALTQDIATEARDIATKAPDVATGPWADFVQIVPVILLCLPLLIYGVFLLRPSRRRRLHF